MKKLLLIALLFIPVSQAGTLSLGYVHDVVHAEGTAGLFLEYQGLLGFKPLRGVVGAWRLSAGPEQGDNAYAGFEIDVINVSTPFKTSVTAGVGLGLVSDRDSVIRENEVATVSFALCAFADKACARFRHLSNPGVRDQGHNFLGVHFQTLF
jgi:hypothetical protein